MIVILRTHCLQRKYLLPLLLLLLVFMVSLFPKAIPHAYGAEENQVKKISVQFENTRLTSCIATILELSQSQSTISVDPGITRKISKTVVNKRWDVLLKEILQENQLKLIRRNGSFVIVELKKKPQPPPADSSFIATNVPTVTPPPTFEQNCSGDNFITLGHKYSTGANPYAMVGKCVKLKNITPIQFFSATKALVQWNYRGGHGVVFIEDLSNKHLISNSNSILTQSIGVYEYVDILGAKIIVPHLVIH